MTDHVKIMGILNVTPDSFYDGGKFADPGAAVEHALEMVSQGARIIDVGGESTRPGALSVSVEEEVKRTVPVIEAIRQKSDAAISIDTTKAPVAAAALEAGASMVNDISGMTFDENMAETVARHDAEVVIMHIQGTPGTMQKNPRYDDLTGEITSFLLKQAEKAMEKGIKKEKIILDPGIGFGKKLEDNYRILNNIHKFRACGFPLLIGLSRKSLIGKILREGEDRLPATLALNAVAVREGADIIRVHDVLPHALMLKSMAMLQKVS